MTISLAQIIVWLIVGALAGALAGMVVTGMREGLGRWPGLAVGLIGALIGGAIFRLFNLWPGLESVSILPVDPLDHLVARFGLDP